MEGALILNHRASELDETDCDIRITLEQGVSVGYNASASMIDSYGYLSEQCFKRVEDDNDYFGFGQQLQTKLGILD